MKWPKQHDKHVDRRWPSNLYLILQKSILQIPNKMRELDSPLHCVTTVVNPTRKTLQIAHPSNQHRWHLLCTIDLPLPNTWTVCPTTSSSRFTEHETAMDEESESSSLPLTRELSNLSWVSYSGILFSKSCSDGSSWRRCSRISAHLPDSCTPPQSIKATA